MPGRGHNLMSYQLFFSSCHSFSYTLPYTYVARSCFCLVFSSFFLFLFFFPVLSVVVLHVHRNPIYFRDAGRMGEGLRAQAPCSHSSWALTQQPLFRGVLRPQKPYSSLGTAKEWTGNENPGPPPYIFTSLHVHTVPELWHTPFSWCLRPQE